MKHVYVLRSISRPDQKYIGITANIEARMKEHNSGNVPHTSKFMPWELVATQRFPAIKKRLSLKNTLNPIPGAPLPAKDCFRNLRT